MKNIKYLSLFSGIGGIELGIQQAYESYISEAKGIQLGRALQTSTYAVKQFLATKQPTCIGYSEIDKYAIQIYERQFKHKQYGDIKKIKTNELPNFDLLVGGFPCQSFSIAGKRGGFKDTRGTLFFEIARIIRKKQPRLLLLENVKGLLSHDKGNTFRIIISTLNELGYDCQWQVLNSKNFGVPQNRERVFIIGHLRGTPRPEVFPFGGTDKKDTRNVGEDLSYTIDANYAKGTNTLARGRRQLIQLNKPKHSNDRVYSTDGLSPTLNTMQGGNRQPFVAMTEKRTEEAKKIRKEIKDRDFSPRRGKYLAPREDGVGNCVTAAQSKEHYLTDGVKIRRLTPKECERLQGFPDNWTRFGVIDPEENNNINGSLVNISDSQRYKVLGNAVTVNVIKEIVKKMLYE